MFLCKSLLEYILYFFCAVAVYCSIYNCHYWVMDIALSLSDNINNNVDTKKLHLLSFATTLPGGIVGGSNNKSPDLMVVCTINPVDMGLRGQVRV